MQLETKFASLEAEAVSDEGIISGYASRFNIVDQGGDIVLPGAFTESLKKRHPLMLWSHYSDTPLGRWFDLEEDHIGLRVDGQLAMSTVKGRETFDLLKMKAISGLSIGYRTIKADRKGNARELKQVELFEISIVANPMLMEATIDAVKSVGDVITATKSGDFVPLKRAVEDALRDAGFPAWLAKAQAALAPQALGDGQRDASASETAKAISRAFKL